MDEGKDWIKLDKHKTSKIYGAIGKYLPPGTQEAMKVDYNTYPFVKASLHMIVAVNTSRFKYNLKLCEFRRRRSMNHAKLCTNKKYMQALICSCVFLERLFNFYFNEKNTRNKQVVYQKHKFIEKSFCRRLYSLQGLYEFAWQRSQR